MATEDDDYELVEMSGRIVQWFGRMGMVETDCGKRLPVGRGLLNALGFSGPIKVGDRIHFHARKHVQVSYHINRVRMIIPNAPRDIDPDTAGATARAPTREKAGDQKRIFTGVVNHYDDERGYGFIRTSCRKQLLLHVTCLRASGYRTVPIGLHVTCEAVRRPKGWQAVRLLSPVNLRK